MVYNLALQYTQNIEDAEEVAQDVFVSIYNSIDKFQANSKLSTWIYRITINKSLDFIKAKKTKKRFAFITNLFFEDSNEVKHDKANFNHPGVELENKEAVEKIFHEINQLPTNQKTVIILSRIEQKSQAEVAEIMNLSIKAVESLYQRAKQNLSKKLNN
jgi:RNA polymerase sigma-70 factor (ECF subfamily)